MDDFISREAAFETLSEFYHHKSEIQHIALREALNRVPTADVVEVVRCRDCRYYPIEGTGVFNLKWPIDGYNCPFCVGDEYYSVKPEKDGYCSMGKRREPND